MARHWIITGIGSGLGKAMAKAALERGDRVTGLLRNAAAAESFAGAAPGRSSARIVDVTDRSAVFAAIAAAEAAAPIDILVNNAANSFEGWIEEAEPDDLRALLETNLIAPLHVIQAVLPAMRARRHGHIVNISSGGGILGVPWCGPYSATKFALEGLSEALAQEVKAFGIHVTIVEPGAFRTNLLVRDHPKRAGEIDDYEQSDAVKMRDLISAMGGKEHGNPDKFAAAMMTVVDADPPPLRVALGDDAIAMAATKAKQLMRDIEAWSGVGSGLSYA
ncbi:MAG: SDR family NAD(P)-dependent oxidoreductase [Sphingomonadaceae bacterium]|nr:SDR family NAD(P)-dependent oxidoreductase [Sphingomonadaceae bacterium]